MEVRVSDCLKAIGHCVDFDERPTFQFDDPELAELSDVHVVGSVTGLTGDSVIATAKAECEISLACSRCNQSFRYPMEFEFEELFAKDPDDDLFAENPSFPILDGCRIFLDEAFRQNCLGQIPLRAICKPGCKVPDEFSPAKGDDRWAALKGLKQSEP